MQHQFNQSDSGCLTGYKKSSNESYHKTPKKVNIWKTVYFNFHYFPFKTAIRMPVFIYWRSELYKMQGKIEIDGPITTGMMKFGSHGLGTQDLLYSRTMWEVMGTLIIRGKTNIGRGSKISVGDGAVLTLGHDFAITGNSEIICQKKISFGNSTITKSFQESNCIIGGHGNNAYIIRNGISWKH